LKTLLLALAADYSIADFVAQPPSATTHERRGKSGQRSAPRHLTGGVFPTCREGTESVAENDTATALASG